MQFCIIKNQSLSKYALFTMLTLFTSTVNIIKNKFITFDLRFIKKRNIITKKFITYQPKPSSHN